MKTLLLALAVVPTLALAQTPWQRDCVRWWGGDIPKSQRTPENCPQGRNHWDNSAPGVVSDATQVQSGIVITPDSTYVVNRVGSSVTVIRAGK